MAQKKITDLQLISEVSDTLSIPGDNGIQTYRATGAQLATYMGKVLKFPVAAKTTTYAIAITDYAILCSGSAFTVTLPTAVGYTGKPFLIKKTDASLTNVITIATTSSQTIDGVTTTTLNTKNESVYLFSDGANWQILERSIPSVVVPYTPVFGPGFGTVSGVSASSRRVKDCLEFWAKWTNGTVASNTASMTVGFDGTSGNVTIDTAKTAPLTIIGSLQTSLTSTTFFTPYPIAPASNATTIGFTYQSSTVGYGAGAALGAAFSASGSGNSVKGCVAIVGWNG